MKTRKKGKQGFASMSKERVREIASIGGKYSQMTGRGHRFSSEEARAAGMVGGRRGRGKKKTKRS